MHLGVNQTLLGTVCWLLVFKNMPNDPNQNVEDLWQLIKQAYKESEVTNQFSDLTMSMFCQPDKHRSQYPRLKGRGMELKGMLLPLKACWDTFKTPSARDAGVAKLLHNMASIQAIFDTYSDEFFLPYDESLQVFALADEFCERYAQLHNDAASDSELLFHVLPKHHMFWHLAYRCRWEHPRLGNTCLDEDFVGKIKKIVQYSTSSLSLHLVAAKVTEKFMWGKSLMNSYPSEFANYR